MGVLLLLRLKPIAVSIFMGNNLRPHLQVDAGIEGRLPRLERLGPLQLQDFLRLGEALKLRLCDINWDDRCINIRETKFYKSRFVPLSPSMMKALDTVEKRKMSVLHRSDSGDVSGDNRQVVGYLSAALHV